MNVFPAVGIGILNWNGRPFLEQFIPYLYNIKYPNYTIYVIDNNSTDDSLTYLASHHPQVKIISTGGNFGVAGGYNIGFSQMPEPYLLMLNSDVEVTPDFLMPLVTLMENDDSVAICQPKLLAHHNKTTFEYGGAAGGMIDFLGYAFCRGRIFSTAEADNGQYNTANIFWASGACALIRKQVYEQIGGMYAYFFMHFEEVDLCWRMLANNYKVAYCNQSVVYHVGGGTLSYQSPTKTYFNFRNNLIMCLRNLPWYYIIWWLPLRFLLDQIAAIHFLLQKDVKNTWAVIRAYGGLLRWFYVEKNKMSAKKMSLLKISVTLKKSIIWLYFIKKKTTYLQINSSL